MMKEGRVVTRESRVVVAHCPRASSFFSRLRGLLGRDSLGADTALLIDRCGAVHTVGMRFPLDLIFIDSAWQVTRIVRNVPPGKLMVTGGWHASRVYEIEAGKVCLEDLKKGDLLQWCPFDADEEKQIK